MQHFEINISKRIHQFWDANVWFFTWHKIFFQDQTYFDKPSSLFSKMIFNVFTMWTNTCIVCWNATLSCTWVIMRNWNQIGAIFLRTILFLLCPRYHDPTMNTSEINTINLNILYWQEIAIQQASWLDKNIWKEICLHRKIQLLQLCFLLYTTKTSLRDLLRAHDAQTKNSANLSPLICSH